MRVRADLTQREVAEALEWSSSKIIRIENGVVAIAVTDLWALLTHYGVTDPDSIARLSAMARASKRVPFMEYRSLLAPELVAYYGHERSASAIRQFEPLVIPGLLQVEAYTRALVAAHGIDEDKADEYVRSRRDRQRLFDRTDPPELTFIVDESVLLRPIGGDRVIREQLAHLLAMSKRRNVSIQALPLRVGAHPGLAGSIVLLEFAGPADKDLVFIELPLALIGDPVRTSSYRDTFWELADLSAPPSDFSTYVEKALLTLGDQSAP